MMLMPANINSVLPNPPMAGLTKKWSRAAKQVPAANGQRARGRAVHAGGRWAAPSIGGAIVTAVFTAATSGMSVKPCVKLLRPSNFFDGRPTENSLRSQQQHQDQYQEHVNIAEVAGKLCDAEEFDHPDDHATDHSAADIAD